MIIFIKGYLTREVARKFLLIKILRVCGNEKLRNKPTYYLNILVLAVKCFYFPDTDSEVVFL